MKKFKNVIMTIGSAFISFGFIFLWTIIFAVTGVLLLIDWVHNIWTSRRIKWIEAITDGWADLFDHPFSRY